MRAGEMRAAEPVRLFWPELSVSARLSATLSERLSAELRAKPSAELRAKPSAKLSAWLSARLSVPPSVPPWLLLPLPEPPVAK
jgi:hypothetical protein